MKRKSSSGKRERVLFYDFHQKTRKTGCFFRAKNVFFSDTNGYLLSFCDDFLQLFLGFCKGLSYGFSRKRSKNTPPKPEKLNFLCKIRVCRGVGFAIFSKNDDFYKNTFLRFLTKKVDFWLK